MTTTYAPSGWGSPPANRVFYAEHTKDTQVIWRTDAHGWAIGYSIVPAMYAKAPDKDWNQRAGG